MVVCITGKLGTREHAQHGGLGQEEYDTFLQGSGTARGGAVSGVFQGVSPHVCRQPLLSHSGWWEQNGGIGTEMATEERGCLHGVRLSEKPRTLHPPLAMPLLQKSPSAPVRCLQEDMD